jgi:alkylation response protein AidB-like acyl-CoA dehydrogenase
MEAVHQARADLKADSCAALARLLGRLFDEVHQAKLTRQQHIMFRLASMTTFVETGAALVRKAAENDIPETKQYLDLCTRINAALCAQDAWTIANEILYGSGHWSAPDAASVLASSGFDYPASQAGLITDMDLLKALV